MKEAFDEFAQKGPVGASPMQIRVNGEITFIETPIHNKMMQVYDKFKHLITKEEQQALGIATSHAGGHEGRGEFDSICKQIRKRLWPNG